MNLNINLPIPSYDVMIEHDSKEEFGLKIGIIDADLLGNKNHRFPNLALMKISAYHKFRRSDKVTLLMNYDDIEKYDIVYISKVFDNTEIPIDLRKYENVFYGGTGFWYEKTPDLPDFMEHMKPDYILYHTWVGEMIRAGKKRKEFEYYLDYSIGFMTRGCFRKCEFCVNKKYDKVELHSSIKEFLNEDHKYICLLDDNLFGYPHWKDIIEELVATKKSFQFKQGLDLRLMTEDKAKTLAGVKYKGDYIFAFDDITERDLIEKKLALWRKHTNKNTKLYVLVAYGSQGIGDIYSMFERIKILMKFQCIPYIMRYKDYKNSEFYGTYVNVNRWCNQPAQFKKRSYREWCQANVEVDGENCSTNRYMKDLELKYPDVAETYYDLKFSDFE
jgi:hypothetical protein